MPESAVMLATVQEASPSEDPLGVHIYVLDSCASPTGGSCVPEQTTVESAPGEATIERGGVAAGTYYVVVDTDDPAADSQVMVTIDVLTL